MDEIGRAVGRGFGDVAFAVGHVGANVGRFASDALGAADTTIHHVLPAAVPSWLALGALVAVLLWVTFRR